MQHNTRRFEPETRILPRWIGRVLFLITRRIPHEPQYLSTVKLIRVIVSAHRIYVHRVNSGAIRTRDATEADIKLATN